MKLLLLLTSICSMTFAAQVVRVQGNKIIIKIEKIELARWRNTKLVKAGNARIKIYKRRGKFFAGKILNGHAYKGQMAYILNPSRSLSAINQSTVQTTNESPSYTPDRPIKFALITGKTQLDAWEDKEYLIEFDSQGSVGFEAGYQATKSLSVELAVQSSRGRVRLCAKEGICAQIKGGHAEASLNVNYYPVKYFFLTAGYGVSSTVFNSEDMGNAGDLYTYGLGSEINLSKRFYFFAKYRQTKHKIRKYKTNLEDVKGLLSAEKRSSTDVTIGIGTRF